MLDLVEVLKRPEYAWINNYRDRLCFITLGGSYSYGTNVEGSDIDIRGVVLPTVDELIGLNHFEQRIDTETDTTLYEFNKFIKLVSSTNPNVIEMLGANQYIIFNDIGEELINMAKDFLSKKCLYSFAGYANSQLRRVENALSHSEVTDEMIVKRTAEVIDITKVKLADRTAMFKEDEINVRVDGDKLLWSINCVDRTTDEIKEAVNTLTDIQRDFTKAGQRNNKPTQDKLNKHIMHLVRLYHMCFDILEKGEINTYRSADRDFLLEIRAGKFVKDNQLTQEFRDYLNYLEDRLQKAKELNIVPDKVDYDKINKFVVKTNSKIVTNNYSKCFKHIYR